jgi:hypothetical protein
MRYKSQSFALITFLVMAQSGMGQSHLDRSSLCKLQANAREGERQEVQVEGVLLAGLEGAYLVVAHCSGQATMLDFEQVKDHKKLDRMWRMVDRPNSARGVHGDGAPVLVVFEGEFYGPPVPDQRLPGPIKKVYYPGWDNNATTKLVVYRVLSVRELPANDPCKPAKSNPTDWPCFQKE